MRPAAVDVAAALTPAAFGVLVVAYLDSYFGVPWLLVLLGGVAVALGAMTTRTQLGRHLFAIGGNAEAARRAGIRVDQIKVIVFALAGTLAAIAGLIAVSRQFSASTGTGGGTLLLEAIAAAVIGGASLFGGRGRVYQALLGALVIVSVENGLDLLGKPSSTKDIATGAILVAAVSIDALSRRRRAARGT
jgi:D-xylose transport system permease protein